MNPNDQIVPIDRVPFTLLKESFARARLSCPGAYTSFDVAVSGFRIRLNVVGNGLGTTIRRAFGHLVSTVKDQPDLEISVWDSAATGIEVRGQFAATRRRDDDVEILLKISQDGRYFCEQRDQSVSWLDTGTSEIVACAASADHQYLDERARPFHKLISAWLNDRGVQFVHAGLINAGNSGILFVGNGGAGKSTSSVACLRAGMGYLGDDFVGIEASGDAYIGHGLFASCLLNVDHLKRFPDLGPHAVPAHQEFEDKSILYLDEVFPGNLMSSVPLDAIVLPRVVDRKETTYRPASKAHALFAIAPTSVMFLPRPSQEAFDRLTEMVEKVPAYWLELGSDIDRIPAAVATLAADLRS